MGGDFGDFGDFGHGEASLGASARREAGGDGGGGTRGGGSAEALTKVVAWGLLTTGGAVEALAGAGRGPSFSKRDWIDRPFCLAAGPRREREARPALVHIARPLSSDHPSENALHCSTLDRCEIKRRARRNEAGKVGPGQEDARLRVKMLKWGGGGLRFCRGQ